jgi:hypothetical protein
MSPRGTFGQAKVDVEHAELLLARAVDVYVLLAPGADATRELVAAHSAVADWRTSHG